MTLQQKSTVDSRCCTVGRNALQLVWYYNIKILSELFLCNLHLHLGHLADTFVQSDLQ